LKGKIEYQKSVIMDLEEYLRGNLEWKMKLQYRQKNIKNW
jgi:hypothetical protein